MYLENDMNLNVQNVLHVWFERTSAGVEPRPLPVVTVRMDQWPAYPGGRELQQFFFLRISQRREHAGSRFGQIEDACGLTAISISILVGRRSPLVADTKFRVDRGGWFQIALLTLYDCHFLF